MHYLSTMQWRHTVRAHVRTNTTNAIDEFTADSRGFTKSSRGYTRMYGGFADGFTNGFATDSREFARVRESLREFARVRESSRRIRGWIHHNADIRRIRGLTQIRERIHSGFTRVLTQCSRFTAVNSSMAFDRSLLMLRPFYSATSAQSGGHHQRALRLPIMLLVLS